MIAGCDAIILNQENFLLKNNGYLAKNTLPQHHLIMKPAIKDGFEGRPKNGMFIAVPSIMKENVRVDCEFRQITMCDSRTEIRQDAANQLLLSYRPKNGF